MSTSMQFESLPPGSYALQLLPTYSCVYPNVGGEVCPTQASSSSTPADNDSHYQESAVGNENV